MSKKIWVPVFKHDIDKDVFFFLTEDITFPTRELAILTVGLRAKEIVVRTGGTVAFVDIREFDMGNTKHLQAVFVDLPIAIIGGPTFDKMEQNVEENAKDN